MINNKNKGKTNPNREFSRMKNEFYLIEVRQQVSTSLKILIDFELVLKLEHGSSLVVRIKCQI